MAHRRVVAIHQPNFFPWLGWFDKLARADVFVLLDDAEFSRGSWTNRSRVLVNGQPVWMTAPVVGASHGHQPICDTRINEATPWRKKMVKTLENTYRRSPGFREAYPVIAEAVENPTDVLARYNEDAARAVADRLGLDAGRFVRSSDFDVDLKGTDRLVALVKAVGGDAYLSGGGAGGYQDDAAFEAAGIVLLRSDFAPRPYPQRVPEFVPGLSVVDAVMNCGFRATRELISRDGT